MRDLCVLQYSVTVMSLFFPSNKNQILFHLLNLSRGKEFLLFK